MDIEDARDSLISEMAEERMAVTGEDRRTALMAVKKFLVQNLYANQQENN